MMLAKGTCLALALSILAFMGAGVAAAAPPKSPLQQLQQQKLRAEIKFLEAEARNQEQQSSLQRLERQKLHDEIRQLEREIRNKEGRRGFFAAYGPSLAGAAALVAAVVTVASFGFGQSRQRRVDREQRRLDRRQQEIELRRRFDEQLSSVMADFTSDKPAGAAIWLITFAGPDYKPFHRQVRLVALANLRGEHAPHVKRRLVQVWTTTQRNGDELQEDELDFSGADVADADFKGVGLRKANFKNATLARAQFQGANLQEAHFEGARLQGARFEGADLGETDFTGADLGSEELRSILETKGSADTARFSEQDQSWLDDERSRRSEDLPPPEEEVT
jgi:uncharacterized protein YjbI with pentapeptide repeats